MSAHVVTLNVPEPLYDRLRQRAAQTNRPIEVELLEVLSAAVPADELPAPFAEVISSLSALDDRALWRAARSHLAAEAAAELQELHLKQQREGLSDAEAQRRADLVRQYERAMLVRAHAAALLKQRGHDVSELLVR